MYFHIAAPPGDPFGGNSPHRSETLRPLVLSQRPAAALTRKGRLEEYFNEPFYTVLTHEGEEASSRVNQFLKAHSSGALSVERDQDKKETVVKANGEIPVHVIKLEHH